MYGYKSMGKVGDPTLFRDHPFGNMQRQYEFSGRYASRKNAGLLFYTKNSDLIIFKIVVKN